MKLASLFLMEIALLLSLSAACATVPVNDIPAVYAHTSLAPTTKAVRAFGSNQGERFILKADELPKKHN